MKVFNVVSIILLILLFVGILELMVWDTNRNRREEQRCLNKGGIVVYVTSGRGGWYCFDNTGRLLR